MENEILKIRPLQNRFSSFSFVDDFSVENQINQSFGKPHLVKRSSEYIASNLSRLSIHKSKSEEYYTYSRLYLDEAIPKVKAEFTIELAVFVDAEAYRIFIPSMSDISNIKNMMNVFVSLIQKYYHYPSLGIRIDILLVRLVIIVRQPPQLKIYSTSAAASLKSFCTYAENLNPPNDDDSDHWDVALYVTGTDFIKFEYFSVLGILPARREYERTKGISWNNDMCSPFWSCALVSFSVNDLKDFGEIPALIAAREIGHLLGFSYETENNSKPYIMYSTPKRREYHKGIIWSQENRKSIQHLLKEKSCLRDRPESRHMQNPDKKSDNGDNQQAKSRDIQNLKNNGNNTPTYALNISHHPIVSGRERTAKAQCELHLYDEDANVVTLHDICRNLQCETPHKNKTYFIKPALNGTHCALGKECRGGECVPVVEPYTSKYFAEDNWSEWKKDSCKSSCLTKSQGIQVRRRFCTHGTERTANCTGPYYDMVLCDDSLLCSKERTTIVQFAATKCTEFNDLADFANMTVILQGAGCQKDHDDGEPWKACTVFCRQYIDWWIWYAPRQEMLDFNIDPYFPDGTWCHNKDGQNYYCRQHYCLPENYTFVE